MTIFKKPKNGEALRNENIVIGHYNENMAIIRNEENELFFLYGNSEQVEVGTVVENEYLAPITSLLPSEQRKILEQFKMRE